VSQQTIPKWVQEHKRQIDQAQLQYFKVPVGETEITVNVDVAPEEREGDYSKQYVYSIKVNGETWKLSASEYLDNIMIEALSRGINPFTLIRKGTGKKTRYSIKELA
jgi:hypothetical protein